MRARGHGGGVGVGVGGGGWEEEEEEEDSGLPVRSQIGGENGSRWRRESSITAPQGEPQLKLL